jgi:hypothetical protein
MTEKEAMERLARAEARAERAEELGNQLREGREARERQEAEAKAPKRRVSVREAPPAPPNETPWQELDRRYPGDTLVDRWGVEALAHNGERILAKDRGLMRYAARQLKVATPHLDGVVDHLLRNFVRDEKGWRRPGDEEHLEEKAFDEAVERSIVKYEHKLGAAAPVAAQAAVAQAAVPPNPLAQQSAAVASALMGMPGLSAAPVERPPMTDKERSDLAFAEYMLGSDDVD